MNISDLSYLEVGSDTIAINGGISVSASILGFSTGESTSASAQVKVTSGALSSDGSWANRIAQINLSASGGDFTGNVAISGFTDADQVVLSEGDSDFNMIINPLSFEPFALEFATPLEFEPFFTSYN